MPNWKGLTHFHIRIASAHASNTATMALAPPTHATARDTVRWWAAGSCSDGAPPSGGASLDEEPARSGDVRRTQVAGHHGRDTVASSTRRRAERPCDAQFADCGRAQQRPAQWRRRGVKGRRRPAGRSRGSRPPGMRHGIARAMYWISLNRTCHGCTRVGEGITPTWPGDSALTSTSGHHFTNSTFMPSQEGRVRARRR